LLNHSVAYQLAFPKVIIIALLLGPLDARTVEAFVGNRTGEFRSEVRQLLETVNSILVLIVNLLFRQRNGLKTSLIGVKLFWNLLIRILTICLLFLNFAKQLLLYWLI